MRIRGILNIIFALIIAVIGLVNKDSLMLIFAAVVLAVGVVMLIKTGKSGDGRQ